MLARLYILLPYTLTVAEGEQFPVYEVRDGGCTMRFLPPQRDPSMIFGKRPVDLKLNGKPAFEANVLRIDFHRDEFDRRINSPKKGVKSALGSLRLIREKVGLEEGSLYLDQPRTTQSRRPAFDKVLKNDGESLSLGG